MRTPCASLAITCACAATVAAQEPVGQETGDRPVPGDRVRATFGRPASTVTERLLTVDVDALVVRPLPSGVETGDEYRIDLTALHRLEVSRGTRSHAGRGALIGGAIGLLNGVVATSIGRSSGGEEGLSSGQAFLLFGGVCAAPGAGTGALIGSRVKTQQWEAVPAPRPGDSTADPHAGSRLRRP